MGIYGRNFSVSTICPWSASDCLETCSQLWSRGQAFYRAWTPTPYRKFRRTHNSSPSKSKACPAVKNENHSINTPRKHTYIQPLLWKYARLILTLKDNGWNINRKSYGRRSFCPINVKKRNHKMNTTTHTLGEFCTGCVAAATIIVALTTLATIVWVLFL